MGTTFPVPVQGQEPTPRDARVMHDNRVVERRANRTNRLLVDGQEVKKGTLVVCEPRPVWVGQVTRVTQNGLLTVRWWNTTNEDVQATIELPDDPYLRFLIPNGTIRPEWANA